MPLIKTLARIDSINGITDPSTNVLTLMAPLELITYSPLATELKVLFGKVEP